MNLITRPLVAPPPSSKAFGKALARMLATAHKRMNEQEAKRKP